MKRLFQLFLIFLLALYIFFFYNKYFTAKNDPQLIEEKNTIETSEVGQNNLIKNLKYEVRFDDNTQYVIEAVYSEITYEGEIEIVKMQNVSAKFFDKNDNQLLISSENAVYNNSNYNTEFFDDVSIDYMNNKIKSDNLDLNFEDNIVRIYNNVVYEGLQGLLKTDNVIINLITKNIEIFMNNEKNKVEVISK